MAEKKTTGAEKQTAKAQAAEARPGENRFEKIRRENDLIVVYTTDEAVERQVIRINRAARAHGTPDPILVVPEGTQVKALDAAAMKRAGWCRCDASEGEGR